MLTAVKMRSRARTLPSPTLWRRLALASLGTALAIGGVCAVALSSLANTGAVTRVAVTQQLALIDDAAAMAAFQYQKGFVAEYLLSGNLDRLAELETSRPAFESWLERAHTKRDRTSGARRGPRTTSSANTPPRAGPASRRSPHYDVRARAEAARVTLQGNDARTQRLCICSTTSAPGARGTPSARWSTPSGAPPSDPHPGGWELDRRRVGQPVRGVPLGAAGHATDLFFFF